MTKSPPSSPPQPQPSHRAARPGTSGAVLDQVDRWTDLGMGLVDVATTFSQRSLHAAEPAPAPASSDAATFATTANLLAVLPGAAAALAVRLQHESFDLVATLEDRLTAGLRRVGAARLTSPVATRVYGKLAELDTDFRAQQAVRASFAERYLATVGPQTLDALLARVDIEALVRRVDVEAVLDRIDLDAVVRRVDLDAVVQRVDLDSAVERVDLDRVVSRVDVNDLLAGALENLEVGGLLRDGSGALASSTVGALRNQVGGVAGRITRRPSRSPDSPDE
ncbi:MAG: hypothetical protein WCP28_10485 [Actinomycetes bacterium]